MPGRTDNHRSNSSSPRIVEDMELLLEDFPERVLKEIKIAPPPTATLLMSHHDAMARPDIMGSMKARINMYNASDDSDETWKLDGAMSILTVKKLDEDEWHEIDFKFRNLQIKASGNYYFRVTISHDAFADRPAAANVIATKSPEIECLEEDGLIVAPAEGQQ
jgi:hypothetical protein